MIEANGHESAAEYLRFLHEQGFDCYSGFDYTGDEPWPGSSKKARAALVAPAKFEEFTKEQKATKQHADLYCMMRD
jgi:hypothetical protein